jgi:hypothetical protein
MDRLDANLELGMDYPMVDLLIDSSIDHDSVQIMETEESELPSIERSMYLLNEKVGDLKLELERLKYYLKDLDDSFSA